LSPPAATDPFPICLADVRGSLDALRVAETTGARREVAAMSQELPPIDVRRRAEAMIPDDATQPTDDTASLSPLEIRRTPHGL
jgi:hypothetical protein